MDQKENTVALNELESAKLLHSYGINAVKSILIDNCRKETLESTAAELGFPVVMKVVSNDILHKTDVGCVVLNVADRDAMECAYRVIMENAARNVPNAKIEGVVVQQMLPKGFEVLLGVSTDPQFGQVVMAGLGGILVELLQAVSMRLIPITREDALDMIAETPLQQACDGLRGVRYDREEIVEALLNLSRMVEANPDITEVDINPLLLYGDGRKATAVDAVVVRKTSCCTKNG
ncbi:MAG: acetate--CoA ligase family protein [Eubacteriales bacterium]|nr:acetate--CoA ligase family protein [Eubacteriales bacterium]